MISCQRRRWRRTANGRAGFDLEAEAIEKNIAAVHEMRARRELMNRCGGAQPKNRRRPEIIK